MAREYQVTWLRIDKHERQYLKDKCEELGTCMSPLITAMITTVMNHPDILDRVLDNYYKRREADARWKN